MLLFPLPLARNKENGNIEHRCAPCTMVPVYTLLGAGKGLMETSFERGLGDVPPPSFSLQQKINQKYVFDVR